MRTILWLFLIGMSISVFAENTLLVKKDSPFKAPENRELIEKTTPPTWNTPADFTPYWIASVNQFDSQEEKISEIATPSVFSYKNSSYTGSGSKFILEDRMSTKEVASIDDTTLFRQGLFYGFTLMLVLLNIVCFFLFEEKPYLFYALTLFGASLLYFYSDGLFDLFGLELGAANIQAIASLLFLGIAAHIFFAHDYLNLEEFIPNMKWWTFSFLGFASIAVIFSWITGNNVFAIAACIALFASILSYFIAGVSLFSKKNYAKFYVIAMFIPILFAVDFFVFQPLGVKFLGTETTHLKAAAIAEMLILTYAIMYRMQALKEEHAYRQAEMRIFLRRQEVLSARRKTERIVEDVYLENLIMHYDLDGLEIKLLQYISEGKDNAKIARKLKTSETEVEDLTKELYEKLEIGEQIQQDHRMVDQQPDYIYN